MGTDRPSALVGEIVEQRTEKAVLGKDLSRPYVGLEHMASNSPDLVGSARADTSVSTNSIFERDDILFGKLRPNLRKCVLAPFSGYCSTDIIVLRARGAMVPGFAAKVLQSDRVFEQAVKTAMGTKMPRTSWASLAGLRVFCPDDTEQRRIAAILDTLDDAIHRTEQVIAKLQQTKQGLLHDLLTRGVDEHGDLRPTLNEAPHLYKDSPLGRIPLRWDVAHLADCCEAIVDCPHSTPRFQSEGVLVARTMHIKDGRYDEVQSSRVSETEYRQRIERLEPAPGDLIFTREAPVGEAFVVPEGMRICLGQRVMLLRPSPGRLLGNYLVSQLYSGALRTRISVLMSGTTNPHLNVGDVRELQLPLPPLDEQRIVVGAVEALNIRVAVERTCLGSLRAVKAGLADDLLSGRVRIVEG